MATLQTTYNERITNASAGEIANTVTCDVDSYICETAAGIGFGLAVQQGTAANECALGVAANTFIGITVKDPTRGPEDDDEYDQGSHVNVLYRGDIWVEVTHAVTVGGDVTAATTTGGLSSEAAGATQIAISGARWMTAAAANGLAIVRLSGELPSA